MGFIKYYEYELIIRESANGFTELVNDYLKKGWELHGSPFTHHKWLCQALTKPVD